MSQERAPDDSPLGAPDDRQPKPRERSARIAGALGALVASLLLLAVAAARGVLDPWLLAAAVGGIAAGAALVGERAATARVDRRVTAGRRRATAEALLAHIPDPVILVDRRAVVLEANAAAFGILPSLKVGRPLSFALRAPEVLDGIEGVFRSGAGRRVEYATRIPMERAFAVQIGALQGQRQDEGRVMLFFRDLTEARRLEHMRVDFVANASHELRTPLASLIGFIETLQGPARDDVAARERFLEIMHQQARRMTRLIDDLLSLSRIELRAHQPPEVPLDLVPLIRHMVDTLAPMARARGAEIRADLPEGTLVVLGDRDELLRVVENLVENAIKYGGSERGIEVTVRRVPDRAMAELAVRDYGPGIDPAHLPRLTERFYRVDVASSRDKGGTGLGLAIVKHIVARHRGRLAIESRPGEGACFRVQVPEHGAPE